jgi:DNA-binding NtrC family response regulator
MNGQATTRLIEDGDTPPRVLVVDDDVPLANALRRVLTHLGLDVEVAENGETALQRIEQQSYSVMVLDLRMGGMDGLSVLRAARRSSNAPATILHSAFLDVPTTVTAMREGVSDVVEKPVAARVLADRILELARQRGGEARVLSTEAAIPSEEPTIESLLGDSPVMRSLRTQIMKIARFTDVPVLVEGPTGTGKELVARAIHDLSAPRAPFVTLNCAAVPEQLFESELFGHEAGAFTNARGSRVGLLEEAGEGTVFLDEVGEMPSSLQPKLLRALESREYRRVGSNRVRRFTARIISATNRPLSEQSDGAFRTDLYFRLAGYTIATPPLSARTEDVPVLANRFLARFAERYRGASMSISPEATSLLQSQLWAGNVRELRSVVENAAIMASGDEITASEVNLALSSRRPTPSSADVTSSVPASASRNSQVRVLSGGTPDGRTSLPDLERSLILQAYQEAGANLSRAARSLGIPRSTLRDRLRKFGIR